ncbi:hypothetical protein diail_286 [Diaporthe ilicicola]|nr:hypothetical protein diail_286 [Diaporthe ilicicola]
MGAAVSSRRGRCGLCYFELPEACEPVNRHVLRRYVWREGPPGKDVQATEALGPFDAPLKHTTPKDIQAKCIRVILGTEWSGLQESVSRGCRGCQAIAEVLLAAAADDNVDLDVKSKMNFEWEPGFSSKYSQTRRSAVMGLLSVRMKVRTRTADPGKAPRSRPTPFNMVIPLRELTPMERSKLTDEYYGSENDNAGTGDPHSQYWTFRIDVSRVEDEEKKRHSHPFAYETPVAFGDTGSKRSLQQIDDWVRECISTHKLCGEEQKMLPDRVLELTAVPDDEKTLRVRLVETGGIEALYVCLSHRWGPSTPSCRTMNDNVAQQKKNIDWNKLLKTFQDAALVTVALGVKYIWIDSLCIIQDNAQDWMVQAAKMCDIYRGAYVTLAASCSDDSTQGMFRKSSCCRTVKPRGQGPSYAVRRAPEHPTWDQVGIMQMQPELPLLTRSWVYQERLLSPRIVHFTRYELMFECSQPGEGPTYCECQGLPGGAWGGAAGGYGAGAGDLTTHRKFNHAEVLRASPPPGDSSGGGGGGGDGVGGGGDDNLLAVRRYWHQLLQEYSGYRISSTADKLPALAGIARQYGTAHPELGRYVAGMWEQTLVYDLMWFSKQGDLALRATHLERPPHIAPPERGALPTWSWIATGQYVNVNSGCPRARPDDLRVLGFDFELSGPDVYGAIRGAWLELEGFVAAGTLVLVDKSDLSEERAGGRPGFQGARGGPQDIYADYPFFQASPDMLEAGIEISCLRTGFVWGGKNLVIVLRRVSEDGTGVFERIGMITEAPRDWMDAVFSEITSKTTIKII